MKAIALVVIGGGDVEVYTPDHVDVAIVDIDNNNIRSWGHRDKNNGPECKRYL